MLDDILKSVNHAEAEADRILKDSEEQAASLLGEARAKAQAMKEDTLAGIKAKGQKLTDDMQSESSRQMAAAAEKAGEEAEALRALIAPKRKKAVTAVIDSLL